MSTKLYHGLRLVKGAPSLLDLPVELEKIVRPYYETYFKFLYFYEWSVAEKKGDLPKSPTVLFFDLEHKIKEAEKKGTKDFLYGIEFSITFLKGSNKRILANPYCQRSEYRAALLQSGIFEAYPYWDNSDEPEGVTASAWSARGSEWEKAMAPHFRGIDRGLTWEFKPMLLLDLPFPNKWTEKDFEGVLTNPDKTEDLDKFFNWVKGVDK